MFSSEIHPKIYLSENVLKKILKDFSKKFLINPSIIYMLKFDHGFSKELVQVFLQNVPNEFHLELLQQFPWDFLSDKPPEIQSRVLAKISTGILPKIS